VLVSEAVARLQEMPQGSQVVDAEGLDLVALTASLMEAKQEDGEWLEVATVELEFD
jgi:hypothetical protein